MEEESFGRSVGKELFVDKVQPVAAFVASSKVLVPAGSPMNSWHVRPPQTAERHVHVLVHARIT